MDHIRLSVILVCLLYTALSTSSLQAMSSKGITVLKKHEGLHLKSYWDVNGWAIGYGQHAKWVKRGTTITPLKAEYLLKQQLSIVEKQVRGIVKRKMTTGQLDSFISICYNMGIGGCKNTKMIKLFNQGKVKAAGKHFTKYCYAGKKYLRGLKRRRLDEQKLYYSVR